MTQSEHEMVRTLIEEDKAEDRFTSLQPTYEDTVPPGDEWETDDYT